MAEPGHRRKGHLHPGELLRAAPGSVAERPKVRTGVDADGYQTTDAFESTPMNGAIRPALLSLCFALTNPHVLPAQHNYATPIMAGINNHGQNKTQPYVTAGDRTYLIGTQDGNFPDLGQHVPGEMGGLWLHPIKLIDGFWAEVTDLATSQDSALSKSTEFVNYPYGNRFRYGAVLDSLEIERFQFSPDGQPGMIV